MDFDEIVDGLYLGGALTPNLWCALQDRGITVCVSLRAEALDRFDNGEPEAFLWLPTVDGTAVGLEALLMAADFIHAALSAEKRVFVHCAAGVGRSPMACAAYLMKHRGMAAADAVSLLEDRRPWVSLNHRQQMRLFELEQALRGQR